MGLSVEVKQLVKEFESGPPILLKDVAALARVHRRTLYKILNGHTPAPRISTYKAIRIAIEKLKRSA